MKIKKKPVSRFSIQYFNQERILNTLLLQSLAKGSPLNISDSKFSLK